MISGMDNISEKVRFEFVFNLDYVYSMMDLYKEEDNKQLSDLKSIIIDLISRVRIDSLSCFDTQASDMIQSLRTMMRSIPNSQCNELISIAFIWMIKWISTLLKSQKMKLELLEDSNKVQAATMKTTMEKRWKKLEKQVKLQIEAKDNKIKELQLSLERVIADKLHIEDILRNRDEEINLLMRNTDFSCK